MDNKPEQEASQSIESPPTPKRYDKRKLFEFFKPFVRILKPLSPSEKYRLSSTSVGRSEIERIRMDRRNLFKLGAAAGILLSKGGTNVDIKSDTFTNPPIKTETQKPSEVIFKVNNVNLILNLAPGPDRDKAEHNYTDEILTLNNLKHIDQAFWFVANAEDRVRLLEKRGEYRKSGNFGLRQLTAAEKKFCADYNFHEEWVAICIDSHLKTKEILQKQIAKIGGMTNFIKEFRPDLYGMVDQSKISIDDLVLPIGALIGIAWNESKATAKDGLVYACVDVGKLPAINNIKKIKETDDLVEAKQKMVNLYKLLSVNSVEYKVNKVPGGTTGDIGSVQFRPDTAYDLINFCKSKDLDFSFNPSGLDAVTAACLMLSIGQKWQNERGKDEYRLGFISGEKFEKNRKIAMQRWNQLSGDNILEWNDKFQKYEKL